MRAHGLVFKFSGDSWFSQRRARARMCHVFGRGPWSGQRFCVWVGIVGVNSIIVPRELRQPRPHIGDYDFAVLEMK